MPLRLRAFCTRQSVMRKASEPSSSQRISHSFASEVQRKGSASASPSRPQLSERPSSFFRRRASLGTKRRQAVRSCSMAASMPCSRSSDWNHVPSSAMRSFAVISKSSMSSSRVSASNPWAMVAPFPRVDLLDYRLLALY